MLWWFKTPMQKMNEIELIYIRLKLMTEEAETTFEAS
jgi:hypothetical protein